MRIKTITLWIGCIVTGLVLMYAGGHMGAKRSLPVNLFGFRGAAVSSLFQQRGDDTLLVVEKSKPAAFDRVNITVNNARVYVTESDRFAVEIGHYADQPIEWEVEMGLLTVSDHSWNTGRISLLDWSLEEDRSAYVTVYCPADALADVNVETVSGRIEISGLETESLNLESVSGRMEIQDCTAEWMNLETVSGRIETRDCAAARLNAETVSGRIELAEMIGDDMVLSTVSGRIQCETERAADAYDIQLSTVSGRLDINGNRVDKKEYVDFSKKAAPYSLMATSVSGRIELRFAS